MPCIAIACDKNNSNLLFISIHHITRDIFRIIKNPPFYQKLTQKKRHENKSTTRR